MKKNLKKAILISIILVGCIFLLVHSFNKDTHIYIELTQLCDNTNSQMMGYFIKTEHGKTIVVDGGTIGDSPNLQKWINENGGKVDYWFLTHYHIDHTGAISDIINNTDIQIDNIVYSFCNRELVEQYEVSRINQYDTITTALNNPRVSNKRINPVEQQIFNIDNIKIKIVSIYKNDIFNNLGNNTSMVFKIYVDDKSILFLGDTGIEKSNQLIQNNLQDLKSDYVQMAHHGQAGATEELYKIIDPEYCLWPTPDWLWDNNNGEGYNTGTYKTIETREWMKKFSVKENYIEKDGDITIKIGGFKK